jgi:prevent-host-death family protein
MDAVGIRQLKAHLSRHLRRVQGGAHLTITDRGRAIAVLAPAEPAPQTEWALRLVSEGGAHWNGGKPAGLARRVTSRGPAVSSAVIEDRR